MTSESTRTIRSTLFKMNRKKAIESNETTQQSSSSTTSVANQNIEEHFQHLTVQTNNLIINQRTRRHSKTHNLITLKREGVILTREFSRSHEVRDRATCSFFNY